MATLTHEQIDLLNRTGGQPLRLVDPATNQEYVLLTAEVYERLHSAVTDLDPRETYPALHRALEGEGWDEPQMDEYNRYG